MCYYTLCYLLMPVFDSTIVVRILFLKTSEHYMVCGQMIGLGKQSETYTTELFLPGTWLLYTASFFLVKCVTGFTYQVKMELSEEDDDIISKWFKVVNFHSTMKNMFTFNCLLLLLQNINNLMVIGGGQM